MATAERSRSLPLSLADRTVLQKPQAESSDYGFFGLQRQCGALADLDRSVGSLAVAFPGLEVALGFSFWTGLHLASRCALAPLRLDGSPPSLWDSRCEAAIKNSA